MKYSTFTPDDHIIGRWKQATSKKGAQPEQINRTVMKKVDENSRRGFCREVMVNPTRDKKNREARTPEVSRLHYDYIYKCIPALPYSFDYGLCRTDWV